MLCIGVFKMGGMSKEDFVRKMMANEDFKKAERRRKLIWEKKKGIYDYVDFSSSNKLKEQRKSR